MMNSLKFRKLSFSRRRRGSISTFSSTTSCCGTVVLKASYGSSYNTVYGAVAVVFKVFKSEKRKLFVRSKKSFRFEDACSSTHSIINQNGRAPAEQNNHHPTGQMIWISFASAVTFPPALRGVDASIRLGVFAVRVRACRALLESPRAQVSAAPRRRSCAE